MSQAKKTNAMRMLDTAGIAYGGSVMWMVFFLFGGMFLNAKRDIK